MFCSIWCLTPAAASRSVLFTAFVAGSSLEDGVQAVSAVVHRPQRQPISDRPDREVHLG